MIVLYTYSIMRTIKYALVRMRKTNKQRCGYVYNNFRTLQQYTYTYLLRLFFIRPKN